MNINQLKEIAQKKKGRDVPCDALESALEIIEQASKVTRFEALTQEVGIDIEQRIKEIERQLSFAIADETKARTKIQSYKCGYHNGYQDGIRNAFNLIKDLQSEVERYKSLYETNSAAEFKDEVIHLNKKGKYTIKFEGCFPEPPEQNH